MIYISILQVYPELTERNYTKLLTVVALCNEM